MPRLQTVAVVLLALASLCVAVACDPCNSMSRVHNERCAGGDQASCEWLGDHIVGGSCEL